MGRSVGWSDSDVPYSIEQTDDEGYIVAGSSDSDNGDVTGYHGSGDYWIVKLAPEKIHGVTTSNHQVSALENGDDNSTLSILSNPANNRIEINYSSSGNGILELDDLAGRKLSAQAIQPGSGNTSMDVSNIPAGIYLVKLVAGNKKLAKMVEVVR